MGIEIDFLLDAYRDLSTCRPGEGPIPWTAVTLYADRVGLEADTRELLWSVIRIMDVAERNWVHEDVSGTGEGK